MRNKYTVAKTRVTYFSSIRFLVQRIDENGAVVEDDVSGFPMSQDGAHTVLRMMTEKHPQHMYILVPMTGGEE
tara:strand:- start:422 stop:640 length:219 start_codon:yes stop_codon:yes gene_type:complete